MSNKIIIENILKTKKISSLTELKDFCEYMTEQGVGTDRILEVLADYDIQVGVKGVILQDLVRVVVAKIEPTTKKGKNEEITFYKSEIEYLRNVGDEVERKILYLLLAISKYDNHPSGWIKYKRELLFKFWGFYFTNSQKTEIMNRCCESGAIDLRVVGSKNPIVCFKVNFRSYDFANAVAKLRFEDNSITDFYDSYLYGENR